MPLTRDEILAHDKAHVWHPYTALDEARPPLVVERAAGASLFASDGTRYLDGNSSWWAAGLGHQHPRLVAALVAQAQKMCHVAIAGITHEGAAALAAELVAVAPRDEHTQLTRVVFSDNGSTAIESAVRIAAQYFRQTGRPEKRRFVALSGAFHGETLAAASLGGVELFRRAVGSLTFDAIHVPPPLEAEGASPADEDRSFARAFLAVESLLATNADTIAAIVVEPVVQGAAGMRMYDARFLRQLRAITRTHDVLLIVDEVFAGYGRTGTMWGSDHAQIAPDLLCLGKTYSGGMLPMAATLASEKVAEAFRGGVDKALLYGHTFCGNPLGAAVAREVLAVFRDEDVLGQVARKAPRLRAAVLEIARRHPDVARRPRALGMVAAVDIGPRGYLGDRGWRVYDEALQRGAYLRPLGDTVYLAPPLTTPPDDVDRLCSILVDSVDAALK